MNTPSKKSHILVVDDAPLIRGLLVQVLQRYGYEVDTAENGQQAIDYFLKQQPDLILLDADMPIMDGVTACAHIRELPQAKHLPIIMVTSFVEREWVDRAYLAGVTDYITKPVNWDVLRNRIHYILQAKQAEEALFEEKEKAQITLASIGDGVITTNASGRIEYLNAVATKLTGWKLDEAYGLPLPQIFRIIDENTGQPLTFPLHHYLEAGQTVELSSHIVLIHCDQKQRFAIENTAAPIRDRNGNTIGLVLIFHDVTESRKMTQELSYQAKHDALTGLYNRHEFETQLKRVLELAQEDPMTVEYALLYMDLDQFKIVNDSCGHEAGDQLLKDVAKLLQKTIDEDKTHYTSAILARLGGDEFALLLEPCSLANAMTTASILCHQIEKIRFFWGNPNQKNLFTIGISIGLVPFTNAQTLSPKTLLAMADTACYAAKNAGRNGVYVYQDNDLIAQDQNIQWVSLIQHNLEQNQGFSLYYQPILSLCNQHDRGIHYEILLRMNNTQGQLVRPGAFFSAAARYNLMPNLDLWVIRTVLTWLNSHPQQLEQLTFNSINISIHSINDNSFLETVLNYLQTTSIPLHKLCFEIDETTAITSLTGTVKFITAMKQLGCQIAIDNFGTGMASFLPLKNLAIDFLKISGTFIQRIADDPIDYAIVNSINQIAHLMHLRTIAENVENQQTVEKLKEINIDYVQGHWLGEPQLLLSSTKSE